MRALNPRRARPCQTVGGARFVVAAAAAGDPCIAVGSPAGDGMSGWWTLNFAPRFTGPRRPPGCRRSRCAGAHEHPRPRLLQRFGARPQPGASALRPRVPLAMPARVSSTPRASPDIPSHHAPSIDSRTPRAVSAHAARRRPRCPSTRNPSTIDPNHDRKRRHHRARAARSPWGIVASCSCGCSCACTSTASTALMAACVAAGAAGSRRVRRLRSQDRAHAAGRRPRRPSGGARWPCTRHGGRLRFWSDSCRSRCSAWCAYG